MTNHQSDDTNFIRLGCFFKKNADIKNKFLEGKMKKSSEVKYPHAANLFQFCRRVLDHKFGGIRVIDQDVGQILGFDPADCSHWKKGKKNVRSIYAMKKIAEHLGVDEKLVVDVASGELGDEEAYFETIGYGSFEVDNRIIESAKKDYYRKYAGTWTREKEIEFKNSFNVNETLINKVVKEIHQKIDYKEAPLYLPEVVAAYPKLQLMSFTPKSDDAVEWVISRPGKENAMEISYLQGKEMRPYVRYRIAKEMSKFFLQDKQPDPVKELGEHGKHLLDVQGNMFAQRLLVPANLIKKEMAELNVTKDLVSQLAELFWVSKGLMNRRLKEILEKSPEV